MSSSTAAAPDHTLSLWLRDHLLNLLGYTNSTIESFLLTTASDAVSYGDFLQKLEKIPELSGSGHRGDDGGNGSGSGNDMSSFLRMLYLRVPRRRRKEEGSQSRSASGRRSRVDVGEVSMGSSSSPPSSSSSSSLVGRKRQRPKPKPRPRLRQREEEEEEEEFDPADDDGARPTHPRSRPRPRPRRSRVRVHLRGRSPDPDPERSTAASTNDDDQHVVLKRRRLDPAYGETEGGVSRYEERLIQQREEDRDLEERANFEKKMVRKYEEEQQKKQQRGKSHRRNEEEEAGGSTQTEAPKNVRADLDRIRVLSRRRYLTEREETMILQAKKTLELERLLWSDDQVTQAERNQRRVIEQVINMAEEKLQKQQHHRRADRDRDRESEREREQQRGRGKGEHYVMPRAYRDDHSRKADQDARFGLLKARYDGERERETGTETTAASARGEGLREWEREQMQKAGISRSRKRKKPKTVAVAVEKGEGEEPELGLLVDEARIEFVANEMISGSFDDDVESLAHEKKIQEELAFRKRLRTDRERIAHVKTTLPMFAYRETLIQLLAENQIVIVVGETGSGKTTQIPQYLYEAGYCRDGKIVACTQPRRVAAMSVAVRVSVEMGERQVGSKVGYSIRFEDVCCEDTVVKYLTDGMLLREFMTEPDLQKYSVIMIDEAHERSLHTDILFALVKDVVHFRPDFRLIVSSATLQAEKFSTYFDGAPMMIVPGRAFPVDVLHTTRPEADYVEAAVVTILQIHLTQPRGDVLVFFTGQEEIETCEDLLKKRVRALGSRINELIIVPIYGNLPSDQQVRIFQKTPPNARKVVLATNIAETSVTIDDVVFVIDTGFCKQNTFDPRRGMSSLVVTPISQQNAVQRTGRAGRTAPGKCFRLYTKAAFQDLLPPVQVPEIQRTNMANVVLTLKSLGIHDLLRFDFMDPPPAETLINALQLLYALGAMQHQGGLTTLGRKMAEFPLDPCLSKTLIASEKYGVGREVAAICSMLSVNTSIFHRPRDKVVAADHARKAFFHPKGDHLTLLNVWNEWISTSCSTAWCYQNFVKPRAMRRSQDIFEQLIGLMERVEMNVQSNPLNIDGIRKSFTSGFFFNAAQLSSSGNYETIHKHQTVHINPSSCLYESQPRWVLYFELVMTSREFMRQVIEIDPGWLSEIAPHIYRVKRKMLTQGRRKMPMKTGRAPLPICIDSVILFASTFHLSYSVDAPVIMGNQIQDLMDVSHSNEAGDWTSDSDDFDDGPGGGGGGRSRPRRPAKPAKKRFSSKPINQAFFARVMDESRRDFGGEPVRRRPGPLGSITVRAITDETQVFPDIQTQTTVAQLMMMYHRKTTVPLGQIRFMKMTGPAGDEMFELMKPDRTVGSFGLRDGDTIVHLYSSEDHGLWDRWRKMGYFS